MKKFYTTLARNDVKSLRSPYPLSLVKGVSFAAMVAFLSNVSPSFSANSDFRNASFEGAKGIVVAYPQSILSAYDGYKDDKKNYLKALNVALTSKVNASEDYANFLTRTLLGPSDESSVINVLTAEGDNLSKGEVSKEERYERVFTNRQLSVSDSSTAQQFVYNDENAMLVNISDLLRGGTAGMQRAKNNNTILGDGIVEKGSKWTVVIGDDAASSNGEKGAHGSVVIGYGAKAENGWNVLIGFGAEAVPGSYGSVVLGRGAKTEGVYSIAIGGVGTISGSATQDIDEKNRVLATGNYAMALGYGAKNYAEKGIVLGYNASATKEALYGIAIGAEANSMGGRGIALGYKAQASNQVDSIAIGYMAHAMGRSSVAIGSEYNEENGGENDYTTAKADYSTAVGAVSKALGYGSTALGHRSQAISKYAISLGFYSKAKEEGAVAIGVDSVVGVENGVALGRDSVANRAAGKFGYAPSLVDEVAKNNGSQWQSTLGAVSVGDDGNKKTRQITGVAAGSEATDAVNVTQLRDLKRFVKENGWKLSVGGANGTTVLMDGDVDFSAGSNNLNITKGDKDNKLKFDLAKDVMLSSAKVGGNTLDATGLVITGGPKITTDGIGAGSKKITGLAKGTDGTDAVNKAQLDQDVTTLSDKIEDVRSVAVLYDEEADTEEVSAFTRSARKVNKKSVTFGDPKEGPVALHNVADGKIAKDSHDAVNGSQLFETNQNVATYFGGGAGYSEGTWTAPKFTVKSVKDDGVSEDKVYDDVASALTGVGTSLTNVQNKFTEQVNNVINKVESESFVQQDKTTHLLTIGAAAEGAEINIANKDKGDRILSGVKTATKDNEAVNKGQLDESLEKLSNSLQSDESAVVHYDKTGDENSTINYKSVTLGGKDKDPVGLHNVADGAIAKDSRDAINGSQLHSLGTEVAKSLGGTASYENGTWTAPTFTVKSVTEDGKTEDKSYNNVASAFAGVGTSFTNVNNSITKIKNEITKEIADAKSDSLNWSETANAFVAQHGENKDSSKITSLQSGEISATSTDAVNGSQLYSLGTEVATYFGGGAGYAEGTWTAPTFTVKSFKNDGSVSDATYHDVASAFEGVGDSFTNVKNEITNVKNEITNVKGDSLVKWDDEKQIIKIGAEKGGNTITIADKDSKGRILSGVKAAEKSDEAVNKAQLDENVIKLSQDIEDVRSVAVFYDTEEDTEEVSALTRSARKANKKSVTFGNPSEGTVALRNVGIGKIAENSTDAVNGSQLHSLGDKVATYFGGGAKYENGQWVAPAFKVKTVKADGAEIEDKSYNDVASAFEGVGTSFTNITNEIKKEIATVQGDALLWSESDKAFVATHGENKNSSKITSLQNGEISANSTDAINGSQLYSLGDKVATYFGGGAGYKDGAFTGPTYKLSQISKDGDVTDNSFTEVGKAFEGLDTNIKNVNQRIKDVSQGVAQDSLLWSKEEEAFVARHGEGNNKNRSKIKFLAGGDLSKDSTDAVNGGQINTLGGKVAAFFGGGADFGNGNWNTPTFKFKTIKADGTEEDKEYQDVASAFAGVGTSFTDLHNAITKEINNAVTKVEGDSLVKQDKDTDSITIGKETNGTVINVANKNGVNRVISGVEDAKDNNDAVNKGQLDKGLKDLSNSLQSDDSAVVHYDKKGDDNNAIDYASVTLGKGKDSAAVGLHNVADGTIGEGSHDAITGGQVNTISQNIAKYLGGEAAFNNGTFTGPTYKLSKISEDGAAEKTSYDNVGSAFEGLDTNIKNVNQRIKEVSQGVAQDSLSWDKGALAFVAKHGEEKTNSKITFLANGGISAASTDAVNGSQLYSLGDKVAKSFGGGSGYTNGEWSAPSFTLKTVNADGSEGEDKSYTNVADALAGVSSSLTNIKNDITNVVSNSLVKWDEDKQIIKIGAEKYGNTITIADKDSKTRTLSGIKAAEQNDEAVNKAQLDENVDKLSKDIEEVRSVAVFYDTEEDAEELSALTRSARKAKQTSVTFGNPKEGTVALRNVGNGKIAKDSHDAVNGDQLHSLGDKVATYFGGSATFKDGTFTAPTYEISNVSEDGTVTESSYSDVGSAFAGLDTSVKNVNTHLANEVKKFDEKITNISKEVKGDALLWSDAEKAFVATHGAEGTAKTSSKITSLQNGDISESSTDAVAGNQLHSLGNKVATYFGGGAGYAEGQWTAPKFTVKKFNSDDTATEESYDNVASAFEGVGASFENVKDSFAKIKNEIEKDITTVQGDALLWGKEEGAFVATHGEKDSKTNSKITSLLDGAINDSSTDAVAGNQLHKLGTGVAKSLGGNAKYDNGQWSEPTFKVKIVKSDGTESEESYSDVASAFAGVGSSFTDLHKEVKNEINKVIGDSLVKQDKDTDPITIGNETNGTVINVANKSGMKRVISGVEDAKDNNDAVNKGQLEKGLKDLSNSLQSDDSAVVHYDKKGDDNNTINYASVTLGKGQNSAAVALHNVADGAIGEGSHDAITGGQVNTISQNIAKYLGGEAAFNNGTFTGPTYKLSKISEDGAAEKTSYDNVGSAFEGLDTNIKNVNQRIKEVSQGVAQDSLLWDNDAQAFVAKHGENKANSKITSILAGTVSESSTDAITGHQLHSLGDKVATYFGGGAKYDSGQWTAPTFTVKTINSDGTEAEEKDYKTVADALASVGASITNVHQELNNEITNVKGDSLVKWDEEKKLIKIGGEKEGATITIADKDSQDRILSGVKKAENTNEAVNKAQLDENVDKLSNEIEEVRSVAVFYDTEEASEGLDALTRSARKAKQTSVTFGNPKEGTVALRNVAEGKITDGSHDAVNGGQLYSLGSSVAKSLGGDASYENGAWTAPTFKVKTVKDDGSAVEEQSYESVAAAFEGVGTSFTNIHNEINKEIDKVVADSFVKQDAETKVIKIGGETGGTEITLANNEGKDRTLSGVKAAANDNEAVNKGQLDKRLKELSDTLQSEDSAVVLYDKDSDGKTNYGSVTFGKGKDSAPVGLHNIAEGKIAKDSHDAINGSQINKVSEDVAKFLGGDTSFKDGAFTGPTYKLSKISTEGKVEEDEFKDVGAAFAGLDTNIKNVNQRIKEVSEGVAQDSLSWSKEEQAFVALHGEGDQRGNSKLTSLLDGAINESSTDAITGGQLHKLGTEVAKSLGGDASYENGAWTTPSFKVKTVKEDGSDVEEQSYESVAEAFAGVGTSFKNIHNEVKNEINKVVSDSLVKQDDKTHVISIGGEKGGTSINIANTDGTERTLSGVHAGKVSEGSTDAVNGSQLYSMNKTVATYFGGGAGYAEGKWTAPSFTLKTINSEGHDEEKSYSNVAEAFAGVGSSFTNIHKEINKEIDKVVGDSLVKQDDKTHVISIGSEKVVRALILQTLIMQRGPCLVLKKERFQKNRPMLSMVPSFIV